MRIAVIGSGYVGLVSAACLAEMGHQVISVDTDVNKIAALKRGEVPIHESLLPELLQRHRGKRLTFSSSLRDSVIASEAVFITVGTPPSDGGAPDLSYVESVASEIAPAITEPKLIVEKVPVPVCACESIRKVLVLNRVDPARFSVPSNPEFLREGTAVTDFLYPDRIVLRLTMTSPRRCCTALSIVRSPKGRTAQKPTADMGAGALPRHGTRYYHECQERRTDQARLECVSRDEDLVYINMVANLAEHVGADIDRYAPAWAPTRASVRSS